MTEGPYEAGPPELDGTLKFPCCGENWTVTANKITHVRCPDCGNLYVLTLKFSINPAHPNHFPKGTWVRVTKDFTTKVGAQQRPFVTGEKYRVSHDAYGVLSTPEDGVLLEVDSPGILGKRTLLAVAPLSNLTSDPEEVNVHHTKEHAPNG
jgi:hypothetical protein